MKKTETEKTIITTILPYLLVWIFFGIATGTGSLLTQSILHDSLLPLWLRFSLYCSEITIIFIVLIASSILALGIRFLLGTSGRRYLVGGSMIVLLLVAIFYLVSWTTFHRLGIFLNLTTVRMFAHDPIQLLRFAWHVDSEDITLVLLLAFSFVIVIYTLISFISKRSFAFQRMLFTSVLSLGIFTLILALAGNIYVFTHSEQELQGREYAYASYLLHQYYTNAAHEKTGPLLTLKANTLTMLQEARKTVDVEQVTVMPQKPLIDMERYLEEPLKVKRPTYNVIVLLVESMRKDVLPIYGGARNVMPTVDWIARQSVIFENAYSQATHSNYADLPPLSSHYPLRSKQIHFYPQNPSYPRVLLYDILKQLGYQTSIFSSQNEEWGGMIHYLLTPNLDTLFHSESSSEDRKLPWTTQDDTYAQKMLGGGKISGKLDDSITIDNALEWIKSRNKKTPFAMYINLQNSHYPYHVPSHFQRRFLKGATQEIEHRLRIGAIRNLPLSVMYDQYCDSLAYIDEQIQRIVTSLQEGNEWENTVFVISADTATRFSSAPSSQLGFMIGNGGGIINEVVNVPLIVFAPQLSHKRDLRAVQHIDIVPTVMALLGLPQHPSFQGLNLLSETYPASRSIFIVSQTPFAHQYAIIKDGWQLLYDKTKGQYLLIDLTAKDEKSVRPHPKHLAKDLQIRLQTWISLQLDYYENPYIHSQYYPPVIMDE